MLNEVERKVEILVQDKDGKRSLRALTLDEVDGDRPSSPS
jgi:hypothetical protein